MRARRLASSSSPDDPRPPLTTIHDAPLARGSDASNSTTLTTLTTLTTFTTLSTSTNTSTSSTQSWDSFLMPDTSCDCEPKQISVLEPNSRRSTWDKYLLDAALQRQSIEQDRQRLRKALLKSMKRYYGHEKWKGVDSTENVELWQRDRSIRKYLDRAVLYGDHSRRKSRYVDRKNLMIEKSAFKRRRLSYDESKAGFFSKLKDRLVDDFKGLNLSGS